MRIRHVVIIMQENLVVLEANTIVVTILGTHYTITYRTLHDSPWLIASDLRDDQNSPISKFSSPGLDRSERQSA